MGRYVQIWGRGKEGKRGRYDKICMKNESVIDVFDNWSLVIDHWYLLVLPAIVFTNTTVAPVILLAPLAHNLSPTVVRSTIDRKRKKGIDVRGRRIDRRKEWTSEEGGRIVEKESGYKDVRRVGWVDLS